MSTELAAETSLSRFTRGLVSAVAATDAARRALAVRAGLSPEALVGPFSSEASRRLWGAAAALDPGDDLGLRLAEASTLEDMGVVGCLARASATFGAACERAVQFERLFKETSVLAIESAPAGFVLVDIPAPGTPPWPRHLTEAILALWWLWPHRFAGVKCSPRVVRFQHTRPACTEPHARVFGCPVEFGQARNELVISAEVWSLPLPGSDALLRRYLEPLAAAEAQRLSTGDPLVTRVMDRVAALMPSGAIDGEQVAKALGLSRRTLQRRLRERGWTFADLVDDLRRQSALRLLQAGGHTFTEVAFLVGFAEPTSLRRACRRWQRAERWPTAIPGEAGQSPIR